MGDGRGLFLLSSAYVLSLVYVHKINALHSKLSLSSRGMGLYYVYHGIIRPPILYSQNKLALFRGVSTLILPLRSRIVCSTVEHIIYFIVQHLLKVDFTNKHALATVLSRPVSTAVSLERRGGVLQNYFFAIRRASDFLWECNHCIPASVLSSGRRVTAPPYIPCSGKHVNTPCSIFSVCSQLLIA